MREKRFRITTTPKSQSVAFDEKQKKHYIGIDLEDLLNEQQATIQSLKEENEQLKIANARWLDKSLQDKQIRYSNTNHKELTKKYLQLKEENEQLRQRELYLESVLESNEILYYDGVADE